MGCPHEVEGGAAAVTERVEAWWDAAKRPAAHRTVPRRENPSTQNAGRVRSGGSGLGQLTSPQRSVLSDEGAVRDQARCQSFPNPFGDRPRGGRGSRPPSRICQP